MYVISNENSTTIQNCKLSFKNDDNVPCVMS